MVGVFVSKSKFKRKKKYMLSNPELKFCVVSMRGEFRIEYMGGWGQRNQGIGEQDKFFALMGETIGINF